MATGRIHCWDGEDMTATLLQINFKYSGTRKVYEETFMPAAQMIADDEGLKWKVWIWDEETRKGGGEYLFESKAAARVYLDGPIITQAKENPDITDVSVKQFEILERPTAVTRGPVSLAVS